MRPLIFAAALVFHASPHAAAAAVVLANATDELVRFSLGPAGRPASDVELAPGEVRPFPCGRRVSLAFAVGGKTTVLRLDAYEAYVFIPENGKTEVFVMHGEEVVAVEKGKTIGEYRVDQVA